MMRMHWLKLVCFVLLSFCGLSAFAVPLATVEQVQAPAWLERDGLRQPLTPGLALQTGDKLRTGQGARAYVLMAEGSRVKLGEAAELRLFSQSLRPQSELAAALDVVTGAFRFTTDALNKLRAKRNVTIRVATATVGIRGTDVWGRAAADRDLVALIEGEISLMRAGESLSISPMQYLHAPRGSAAEIKVLTPELLATLAPQTEVQPAAGVSSLKGRAYVNLAVVTEEAAALRLYDQVRALGFAARLVPRAAPGGWEYQVRLTGYTDAAAARAAANRLRALAGKDLTI